MFEFDSVLKINEIILQLYKSVKFLYTWFEVEVWLRC